MFGPNSVISQIQMIKPISDETDAARMVLVYESSTKCMKCQQYKKEQFFAELYILPGMTLDNIITRCEEIKKTLSGHK